MNDYLPLNKGLIFNLTVPNYTKPLPVLPINQIKTLTNQPYLFYKSELKFNLNIPSYFTP